MSEHHICENCGCVYVNFCVKCAQAHRQELVEELMDKYGLSVEALIVKLATLVNEDNFSALNLAISLKNMKPANKTEIIAPLTKELKDVKDRLSDKVIRLSERKKAKGNSRQS
jgi:DNA-directed RNA polymerase subunit F